MFVDKIPKFKKPFHIINSCYNWYLVVGKKIDVSLSGRIETVFPETDDEWNSIYSAAWRYMGAL